MKERINNLCNQYGFNISDMDDNIFSCALGLGDIIRLLSCLKNNFIYGSLHLNLGLFFVYYTNSINYIEFRLKMIKNIIDSNNIDKSKIIFYYNELKKPSNGQIRFVDYADCSKIKNLKLNFNTEQIQENIQEEYIIFHTKSRFHLDKEKVFQDLKIFERFISTFKSKYKIYIIGERQINRNNTEILTSHDIITQIYNILINLSNNNDVIDQTIYMLVDNLDYDNFVKDIHLIQNAKYNIHFGDGGSMNYSLIFGKHNTIIYNKDMDEWDKKSLEKENSFIYNNIHEFLNKLQNEVSSNELAELKPELRPLEKKEELDFVFNKLYNNRQKSNQNAYFLTHGGIGDLFFVVGAVRFLSLFYNKIYFFCPKSALKNMQIVFSDIHIEFITYDKWYETVNTNNSWPKVSEYWYKTTAIYLSKYENFDAFDWKKYTKIYSDLSIFNNKADAWNHWLAFGKQEGRTFFIKEDYFFDWQSYVNAYSDLQHINNKHDAFHHWQNFGKAEGRQSFNKNVDLDADIFICAETFNKNINQYVSQETIKKYNISSFNNKITNQTFLNYINNNRNENWKNPYYFLIEHFYNSININKCIYYDYHYIPSTAKSWELYKKIKDYKIVFLHFTSSCGNTHIPENEWSHIYNNEYLIINPDKNHYEPNTNPIKYELANQYLNLLLLDYIDIIINATDIYVCDSSFAAMIFPLRIKDILKADNMIIYDRFYPKSSNNVPKPVNLSRNK
jgi:hypothetical protein